LRRLFIANPFSTIMEVRRVGLDLAQGREYAFVLHELEKCLVVLPIWLADLRDPDGLRLDECRERLGLVRAGIFLGGNEEDLPGLAPAGRRRCRGN
jgi:hypothetical protein